jgi:methionyl-tRNA formyltransferase
MNATIRPEKPRIVFMGTPEFALPTLHMLVQRYLVVGVVTQPDRPAGRGQSLQRPPVKVAALAHNLAVFQPGSLRTSTAGAQLRSWAPDIIVTAATGHILTPKVLAIPTLGTLNVHASLLPRWRGAAPIQAAVLADDEQTGVTIMCTDEGLDTGPILSQQAIPIDERETASSLHDKLAQLGADLLAQTIPLWLAGEITPQPQPRDGVTIAPRIRKEDGLIQWTNSAAEIDLQVRAYHTWPGAYTFLGKKRLKVIRAFAIPRSESTLLGQGAGEFDVAPGTVVASNDGPVVVTGKGFLRLDEVQPAGKRTMTGEEFLRGRPDVLGARLGAKDA